MLLNKYRDYGLTGNPFPTQVYGESSVYDDGVVSCRVDGVPREARSRFIE